MEEQEPDKSSSHLLEKIFLALALFYVGVVISVSKSNVALSTLVFWVPAGLISVGAIVMVDSHIRVHNNGSMNNGNEESLPSNGNEKKELPFQFLFLVFPSIMSVVFFRASMTAGLLYTLLMIVTFLNIIFRRRWFSIILRSIAAALLFLVGASLFLVDGTILLLSVMIFSVFMAIELMWEISLGTYKYREETISGLYGERAAGMLASILLFTSGTLLILPVKIFGIFHVRIGAIFMAVLFYCAYKMLLDPEKYARESYLLGAISSVFMLTMLLVEGVFV